MSEDIVWFYGHGQVAESDPVKVPTHIRAIAETQQGHTLHEIEARLFSYLSAVWDKEWDAPYRRERANRLGRFWLPCFVCGEWFGGHEIHGPGVMVNRTIGKISCSKCEEDSRRINARWPQGVNRSFAE